MKYVDVAPTVPLPSHKDTYTYSTKESLTPGAIVTIPLGPRSVRGVVVQPVAKKPPYRTKQVTKVHEATLTPEQLSFGAQISGTMLGGLGFTLRLLFPPSLTTQTSKVSKQKSKRHTPESLLCITATTKRIRLLKKYTEEQVKDGFQVLIIVPERWMVARFPWATAFHAGLKASEVKPIWEEVSAGKPMCVVGTQKALFLPWRKLAAIVIDEAYMQTHKFWDAYPRGHNARLVEIASQVYSADMIRGGSIPSLAGYLLRKKKEAKAIAWSPVVPKYKMVQVTFEDRRYKRPVPNELVGLLRMWKRAKKRVFILHNETESHIAKALEQLRLLKKDQIIIGTAAQFAKLQDEVFDQVVWMFPEQAFSFPDVQSSQRGYATLARLHALLPTSTRAVTLVSRHGDFIERICKGSLRDVYERTLQERKKHLYPPYTDMVKLTYKARSVDAAVKRADGAYELLRKKLVEHRENIRILGPYESLRTKRAKSKPERHILLLGPLKTLQKAYPATLPDMVDVDPMQVLTNK